MDDDRYWPFDVLPLEQRTPTDQQQVDFLETAYREKFRPRVYGSENFGAASPSRSVDLVFRGTRNGWEPWLGDGDRSVRLGPHYKLRLGESACVCIRPPFQATAHLMLEWLRGRSLESLLGDFVFVGGYPAGIALRPELVCPSLVAQER